MAILKSGIFGGGKNRKPSSPGLPAPVGKAFTPEYLLGQVDGIKPADVLPYITRIAYLRFLDDYYYGYLYDEKLRRLRYVIHKGDEHIAGKASALSPALVTPGRYFIKNGGTWYMVENGGEALRNAIGYAEPQAALRYQDLHDLPVPYPLPATLVLKWSLEDVKTPSKRVFRFMECGAILFMAVALALSAGQYAALKAAVASIKPPAVIPPPTAVNLLEGYAAAVKSEAARVVSFGGGLMKVEEAAGGIEVTAGFHDDFSGKAFAAALAAADITARQDGLTVVYRITKVKQ